MSRLSESRLWQRVFRTRADDVLPHTVSHQRIYIVPSKRGFAFLVTILLMLVASINYGLSLGYGLCFVLSGLFASALLHTYRNLAGLGVTAIHASDTFSGEAVNFAVTLCDQQGRVRHGIRILTRHNTNVLVRVPENDSQTAHLSVTTHSRGVCELGRLTFQSDWPVGLWTCWTYLHVASEALVFPAPEPQAPALPVTAGAESGAITSAAVSGDVAGLREYQPGDSIGSIAWKSAARGLGLRSRSFENEEALSTTILDLQQAAVPGLEAKLSRLCAWVLAAEQSQTDYGLTLSGFSLDKGRGTAHKKQALKALALHGLGEQAGTSG